MLTLLDKLPTILVLAVLVGIFLSLRKHAPSARLRLWVWAWALIFLHFFIELFATHTGLLEQVIESADLSALELSGVVLVVSLMADVEQRSKRSGLLALLGIPAAFHATAATFDLHAPQAMAAALAVFFFGGAVFTLLAPERRSTFNYVLATVLSATGIWAIRDQLRGSADLGVTAILTIGFGLCGVLFWRRYPRRSTGVLAVSGGFLCWGAVFPCGAILDHLMPSLKINPELWNVPKFFVAFGMVLTLLEDKSRIIEDARAREHAENHLMQRLAEVTSRLLAGKDPAELCDDITAAVTDASSFRHVALLLAGETTAVRFAGSSGFSPHELAEFQETTNRWTVDTLANICANSPRVGSNSFRTMAGACDVILPLVSSRGSYLGCLCLGGSSSDADAQRSEMTKLGVLASDLAVTIENSRLHYQLIRSEKLAALGQLVAGVAHELNNPLTGIIGYTELLSEEVDNEKASKRVHKLGNEARRMKRIVDGLLRFARQNNPSARAADLDAAIRDVVQLREYHLRKLGIQLDVDMPPVLPRVAIGEDELKQVLLNILNNAIDAVEESARRSIEIHVARHGDRLVIEMADSGPGFADLNRAFDPFYTTKPVGKGTGLGLSICYGVVQEAGGEITLANPEPYGARVTLELPVSVAHAVAAIPA